MHYTWRAENNRLYSQLVYLIKLISCVSASVLDQRMPIYISLEKNT
jgi:hypothetical protein